MEFFSRNFRRSSHRLLRIRSIGLNHESAAIIVIAGTVLMLFERVTDYFGSFGFAAGTGYLSSSARHFAALSFLLVAS